MSSLSTPRSEALSVPATDPDTADLRTVRLAGTDLAFHAHPGEAILSAARRAGVGLPFECGWGSCGTCKVTLVDGDVELLFPDAPAITPRDARRRRTVTCQAAALTDVTLKAHRLGPVPERPTRDYRAVLVAIVEVGPDIRCLRFRLDAPSRYRPGQYAILDLGAGLRRCYSMSGLPGDDVVEFIAKRYDGGPGSTALFALDVGDVVELALPFGDMWLRPDSDSDPDEAIVLVAGGTGISPILAIVNELVAVGSRRRIDVLYGAATRAELVCWAELSELVARLSNARLHGVLGSPHPGWAGRPGLVTEPLRNLVSAAVRCYLAGPPPMIDAALAELRAAGVELDHVHYDRFG
ncbi:MAG: 2Fe-2S iron-sulfur cluster-binding protein [Pseudonocardia sp.]